MKKFKTLLLEYEKYYRGRGVKNVKSQLRWLSRFYEYLETIGKTDLRTIKEADIRKYIDVVKGMISDDTKKIYAPTTVSSVFYIVKNFYAFLYMYEYILVNPFEELDMKFKKQQKRRGIFTEKEINEFLDSISISEPLGQRDRAIFELMYSSGLRLGDVVGLDLSDVDMQERVLMIRQGKGDKDAYLPFSEVALTFLQKYIACERMRLLKRVNQEEEKALFLHGYKRITNGVVQKIFKTRLEKSGIEKKDRCLHSIRHSTATHLLEAGADIRFVSELLRHETLDTTVKYTYLPIENLKRAYKKAHPRENDYYEEVTEEYLKEIEKLKEELIEYGKRYCK